MKATPGHLSLSEAIADNRLTDFIVQEEQRGVEMADLFTLEHSLAGFIKEVRTTRLEGQTSRSASSDGSPET